jgi:hypothetical protein
MNAKNFHAAVMAITEELPELHQEAYWEALREVLVRIMDMYRQRRKEVPKASLRFVVVSKKHPELYEILQGLPAFETRQEDINHLLEDTAWRIEIPLIPDDRGFYHANVYHP